MLVVIIVVDSLGYWVIFWISVGVLWLKRVVGWSNINLDLNLSYLNLIFLDSLFFFILVGMVFDLNRIYLVLNIYFFIIYVIDLSMIGNVLR